MALGTLAQLRTAALGPRTDLTSQFPDILALAEQRIFYGDGTIAPLRVLPMEGSATLTFTDGVASLPADFLDKRAIYWSATWAVSLVYEPPSIFYPLALERAGGSYPEAYTLEGNSVKVSPALTGSATLLYYQRPTAMSADGDSNAILLKWPGVYLFGCQLEVYRITRNAEELVKTKQMYADAVSAANNQAMIARTFGGPLRRRVGAWNV